VVLTSHVAYPSRLSPMEGVPFLQLGDFFMGMHALLFTVDGVTSQ